MSHDGLGRAGCPNPKTCPIHYKDPVMGLFLRIVKIPAFVFNGKTRKETYRAQLLDPKARDRVHYASSVQPTAVKAEDLARAYLSRHHELVLIAEPSEEEKAKGLQQATPDTAADGLEAGRLQITLSQADAKIIEEALLTGFENCGEAPDCLWGEPLRLIRLARRTS